MLSESSSSGSGVTDISDDSSINQTFSGRQVRGLPDLFAPSNAMTRPFLTQKPQGCEEMCIRFDGKDYICRICHGGNSSGDLLTPCRCKGSIALTHLKCLEIWLNESNRNACELCQYHFRVVREPKYGVLWSIFVFLRHPEEHFTELLMDLVTLVVYTPSTVTSTYMLLLLCETLNKAEPHLRRNFVTHLMAFSAIFAINFIYTSWLLLTLEKYIEYWRDFYKKNCSLRVILSTNKLITPVPSASNDAP